ncbi:hypothetical protein NEUTE1DRAFT_142047 [Neurospora tetrasperma FGSC 2508]|uniref:Uncharacterized protein n=1 Tax=Neurospora tetrasperma (strain FGSC 2508 / ATCC MYA-4615 / P0657) TaxID=510951 RepID=F8N0A2_NEUT8|nr:uncharacterized protein NEUTE1DRAFT_142047 [Neurospora tetrasperma FGSC 2508]EGO52133.1 hypothetical protein NEUTE1DRAFT_142047 [Neurospora tetrasperma FGSC 2508]
MTSFSLTGAAPNKLTKTRGAKVVKPILKKLSSSPKNSLDLNRGWDEQPVDQLDIDNGNNRNSVNYRSAKDVGFGYAGGVVAAKADEDSVADLGATGNSVRVKYQHARSASQTSSGSGSRAFCHPFQQTPRTATPPLSYAPSLASFDNGRYSPTIAETEDETATDSQQAQPQPTSHPMQSPPPPPPVRSNTTNCLRQRPSIASSRANSYSDANSASKTLRINTGRSTPTAISSHPDAHGVVTTSRSDDQLGQNDSPTGTVGGAASSTQQQSTVVSPTSSTGTPMSPLRTSLDLTSGFPRLRSRSTDIDSAARLEKIRNARRKFEEKERANQEKYDRELIKKRERKDTKEASRIEKESARKSSLSDLPRPSMTRKATATSIATITGPTRTASGFSFTKHGSGGSSKTSRSKGDVTASSFWDRSSTIGPATNPTSGDNSQPEMSEKHGLGFASRKYESVPADQAAPPAFIANPVDHVKFEQTRRRSSGPKRKTQNYWQEFILWLRTKILRLSGR